MDSISPASGDQQALDYILTHGRRSNNETSCRHVHEESEQLLNVCQRTIISDSKIILVHRFDNQHVLSLTATHQHLRLLLRSRLSVKKMSIHQWRTSVSSACSRWRPAPPSPSDSEQLTADTVTSRRLQQVERLS